MEVDVEVVFLNYSRLIKNRVSGDPIRGGGGREQRKEGGRKVSSSPDLLSVSRTLAGDVSGSTQEDAGLPEGKARS